MFLQSTVSCLANEFNAVMNHKRNI